MKRALSVNPVDMFATKWMEKTETKSEKKSNEIVKDSGSSKAENLTENVKIDKIDSKTDSVSKTEIKSSDPDDAPSKSNILEPELEKQSNTNKPNNMGGDITEDQEKEKKEVSVSSTIENLKHPLASVWTYWFYKNDRSLSWEENQRKVVTVKYVEDFWAMYHYTMRASNLWDGCDYSLFKEGINPDWEDCRNAPGGRWIISLDRRDRVNILDGYWREILMFLVGAAMPEKAAEMVNGAAVNIRKKWYKLAVWLSDYRDMDTVTLIGKRIKSILGMETDNTIQFNIHSEEKARSSQPRLVL